MYDYFSVVRKGVFGSAVCAFRVSDIEQVFATSPILADAGRSTLDELPAQQPPLTKVSIEITLPLSTAG